MADLVELGLTDAPHARANGGGGQGERVERLVHARVEDGAPQRGQRGLVTAQHGGAIRGDQHDALGHERRIDIGLGGLRERLAREGETRRVRHLEADAGDLAVRLDDAAERPLLDHDDALARELDERVGRRQRDRLAGRRHVPLCSVDQTVRRRSRVRTSS